MRLNQDICLSGGARGADLAWGETALAHGHDLIHFSFAGHRSTAPHNTLFVLSAEELREADPFLERANRTLGRRWPSRNPHVAGLLRRNYYQVREADAVYAVSTFEKRHVAGGTSWAVQMFLDRFPGQPDIPCYVYDQVIGTWTAWEDGGFVEVDRVPRPQGCWAGIGTRELNDRGSEAIEKVWDLNP